MLSVPTAESFSGHCQCLQSWFVEVVRGRQTANNYWCSPIGVRWTEQILLVLSSGALMTPGATRSSFSILTNPETSWNERLGFFGLYVFSLFAFLGTAGAFAGLGLMLIATVVDIKRFWAALRSEPLLWLFGWAILSMISTIALALIQQPDSIGLHIDAASRIAELTMFLLVAWCLQAQPKRIYLVLTLALTGFVLGAARSLDAQELQELLALERPSFVWSINAFAQYNAAALMGLLIMAPTIWTRLREKRWQWLAASGLLALGLLLLVALILTQSRGVFLALIAVTIGMLVYLLCTSSMKRFKRLTKGQIATTLLLVALSVLVSSLLIQKIANDPMAHDRFDSGSIGAAFEYLQTGTGIERISGESIRERLLISRLGIDYWLQKPLFGWGLGSIPEMFDAKQDLFGENANRYNDFHNIIIDMLVAFGVIGSLSLLSVFVWIVHVLNRAARDRHLEQDLHLLILTLLVFNILCQLTDTRLFSPHGRFYWILFAGLAYTCRLASHTKPTPAIDNRTATQALDRT